jgi:hypothetical protein
VLEEVCTWQELLLALAGAYYEAGLSSAGQYLDWARSRVRTGLQSLQRKAWKTLHQALKYGKCRNRKS